MDWFFQQLETLISFIGDETRQGALAQVGATITAIAGAIWYILKSRRKKIENLASH